MSGWGSSPWGAGEWGAGDIDGLMLLDALAVRENVVRLTFNVAPRFTRTLDPTDASNPARYSITPVPGTVGRDDEPAREVAPIVIEPANVPLSFGSAIDVTVDRPFSPAFAEYIVAVNQLETVSGMLLDPAAASRRFLGLYRILRMQSLAAPLPSRDAANPQTYRDQLLIPQAGDPVFLGIIPINSDGDYAFDQGLVQLRKRIIRRLVTVPGAFASLPGYGVGVPTYGKKLGTAGVRQQIAVEAERQLALEPDVKAVSVTLRTDAQNPSITLLDVRVQSVAGTELAVQLPFPTTG